MKKILVIDDNKDILDVVKIILTSHGFEVRTDTNGSNIDELITDFNPDLILLDIKLCGKPGTVVCRELKETHAIPILLFSACSAGKVAYKECKADGFINKPFEIKTAFTNT
ncbi:MAG: response regulator [Ginsengibacter sp.]